MNSRSVPVSSPQVLLTPLAKRTIQSFSNTPRLPESSMSTRLGNSSTRVGFSEFVSIKANHITESPNMFAKNTQLEPTVRSAQRFSPGVSAAIKTCRASSSKTDASPTVRPFSIRQPSLCVKDVAIATVSMFFYTSADISAEPPLRPKQSSHATNTINNAVIDKTPRAAQRRMLNNCRTFSD